MSAVVQPVMPSDTKPRCYMCFVSASATIEQGLMLIRLGYMERQSATPKVFHCIGYLCEPCVLERCYGAIDGGNATIVVMPEFSPTVAKPSGILGFPNRRDDAKN